MPENKKEAGVARLYRSATDKKLGGVCGGIGEYFNLDPLVVRIVWVAAALFGGFGVLAYIVCWIIIPENPGGASAAGQKPQNSALLWGGILVLVGMFFLFQQLDWYPGYNFRWGYHMRPFWVWRNGLDWLLPLLLIAAGVIYLLSIRKKEPQSETAAKKTTGDKQMEKKLTRSVKDRMVGGVCGGLAEYFNIDPSLVRIGFVLLTLAGAGFPGIIAYIVMLIIIPEASTVESPKSGSSKTGK